MSENISGEFAGLNITPYQWLEDNPWQDHQAEEYLNEDFDNLISCSDRYPVDEKWKRGDKIDLQKISKDLTDFIQEMEQKKSNSYSELEQVIKELLKSPTNSEVEDVVNKLRFKFSNFTGLENVIRELLKPTLTRVVKGVTERLLGTLLDDIPSDIVDKLEGTFDSCNEEGLIRELEELVANMPDDVECELRETFQSCHELDEVISELPHLGSRTEDIVSELSLLNFSSYSELEQEIRGLLNPILRLVETLVKETLLGTLLIDIPRDIVGKLKVKFSFCNKLGIIRELKKLLANMSDDVGRKLRETFTSCDELDQVISKLQYYLASKAEDTVRGLRGDDPALPLTREIIDKEKGETPGQDKSRCEDRYTAQSLPEYDDTRNYDIEYLKVDGYVLRVSVPEHKKELLEMSGFTSDLPPNLTRRWIFIPLYMRAKCGLFDWSHAGIDEKITIRILVVRPSEFKEYQEHCGNHLPIVSLPNNEMGVGYARYWIQKIATSMRLEYIWILDDDVKQFYEIYPGRKPPPPITGGMYDSRRRNFTEVFTKFESIVKANEDAKLAAISPVVFDPKRKQSRKDPPFVRKPPRGAVLLNLKLINEHRVSYRPQLVAFEDMLFGKECEEKQLKVIMWKRIQSYSITNWGQTGCGSTYIA